VADALGDGAIVEAEAEGVADGAACDGEADGDGDGVPATLGDADADSDGEGVGELAADAGAEGDATFEGEGDEDVDARYDGVAEEVGVMEEVMDAVTEASGGVTAPGLGDAVAKGEPVPPSPSTSCPLPSSSSPWSLSPPSLRYSAPSTMATSNTAPISRPQRRRRFRRPFCAAAGPPMPSSRR
jgi:hypothetical protein